MVLLFTALGYTALSALIGAVAAVVFFYLEVNRRAARGEFNSLPRAEIVRLIRRAKSNFPENIVKVMIFWPVFLPLVVTKAVVLPFDGVWWACGKAYRKVVGSRKTVGRRRIEDRYLYLAEVPAVESEV